MMENIKLGRLYKKNMIEDPIPEYVIPVEIQKDKGHNIRWIDVFRLDEPYINMTVSTHWFVDNYSLSEETI